MGLDYMRCNMMSLLRPKQFALQQRITREWTQSMPRCAQLSELPSEEPCFCIVHREMFVSLLFEGILNCHLRHTSRVIAELWVPKSKGVIHIGDRHSQISLSQIAYHRWMGQDVSQSSCTGELQIAPISVWTTFSLLFSTFRFQVALDTDSPANKIPQTQAQ